MPVDITLPFVILFNFAVLEFIYAQSPESMKGLLTGLYYLFRGLSSTVSSALFLLYKNSVKNRELSPFYAVFTIVQVNYTKTPHNILEMY